MNARELQRAHGLALLDFELAVDVDEALSLALEDLVVDGARVGSQNRGKLLDILTLELEGLLGISPDASSRNGRGKNHAVAIENLAALRGHGQGSRVARLTLLFQKVGRNSALKPEGLQHHADEQHEE